MNPLQLLRYLFAAHSTPLLRFKGLLPVELMDSQGLLASFHTLRAAEPLSINVSKDGEDVLVVLCGMGDGNGFLCSTDGRVKPNYLPLEWWSVDRRVHVLAFSCFSASFLRDSGVLDDLTAAICFEGKLWMHIDVDDAENIRFWETFFNTVIGLAESRGRVDLGLYAAVRNLYSDFLVARPSRRFRSTQKRATMSYPLQISLLRQAEALRILEGPRR